MTRLARKYAEQNHEDGARHSTRTFSKHGLSRRALTMKKLYNRAGKRAEERVAFEKRPR